ncbi:MAG: sulfite exporter TauE/SafE family protein, partial [Nanoarchaeota archaeon]
MSTLNKINLQIKGMHCGSCEVLIERNFRKIHCVKKVNVNHATGKAEIYYTKKPNIDELNNLIKEHGYTANFLENNNNSKGNNLTIKKDHLEIGAIFIILTGLYLILKQFDLLPKGLGISDNMSYGFIFLIGLVAAFSTCLAVTGGLLISIATKYNEQNPNLKNYEKFKPHIYFNIGRIISYTVLGGLTGLLGSLLNVSPKINGFLTIFASVIMIILGLQLLNIFPWLKNLQLKMPKFIAHKVYDATNKEEIEERSFINSCR